MPLYRCGNCYQVFECSRPEGGVCKTCDIDPQKEPRLAYLITRLETIHYDPPSRIRHRGLGHLACNPARAVQGSRATGEPSVVNCRACRDTAAWKAAYTGEPEPAADEAITGGNTPCS